MLPSVLIFIKLADPCVSSKPFMRCIAVWTVGLPKKTGLEQKAAASTCLPVEMARPVFEQRIIRIPTGPLLAVAAEGYR